MGRRKVGMEGVNGRGCLLSMGVARVAKVGHGGTHWSKNVDADSTTGSAHSMKVMMRRGVDEERERGSRG
jgi:hypothetical protein